MTILTYYLPSQKKWFADNIPDFAARIVSFSKQLYGFYPQPVLSILPGSKRSTGGFPVARNLAAKLNPGFRRQIALNSSRIRFGLFPKRKSKPSGGSGNRDLSRRQPATSRMVSLC